MIWNKEKENERFKSYVESLISGSFERLYETFRVNDPDGIIYDPDYRLCLKFNPIDRLSERDEKGLEEDIFDLLNLVNRQDYHFKQILFIRLVILTRLWSDFCYGVHDKYGGDLLKAHSEALLRPEMYREYMSDMTAKKLKQLLEM